MARYEDGSGKFWEIDWAGETSFTVKYGKIGAFPTEGTKKHATRAEAEKAWAKQVAEREQKGYARAEGPARQPVPIGKKKAGGLAVAENAELEAAIDENPDDTQALSVYADWLQQQGDPRGELVTLALAKGPKAKKAYAEHFAKHKAFFLGDAEKHFVDEDRHPVALEWQHGFIRSIRFDMVGYEGLEGEEGEGDSPEKLFKRLLSLPSARFASKLAIGMAGNMYDGENSYGGHLKTLAALDPAPPLRKLTVGDFEYPDDCEISWARLGDFSKAWARYPRLEELIFQGGDLKLGAIAAPSLRKLTILSGGLPRGVAQSIGAASWPALEELEIWFGDAQYGGNTKLADLTAILDGPARFPRLHRLGLCNFQLADELAAVIGDAKILKQLRTLDLSRGALTTEGANALAAAAPRLKHLDRLDVSENQLFQRGDLAALKKALGSILHADGQRDPSEWGWEEDEGKPRYVAVGE